MANDIRIITKGFKETTVSVEPVTQVGRDWFEDKFGLGCTRATLPKTEAQSVLDNLHHCCLTHEIRDGAWRYHEAV